MPLPKDPGDDTGRKKAVKAWLQGLPVYTEKHPYPAYVRGGYETMDEFMEGWDWQFSYDAKQKQLTYNPIRDEYAVVQPVTNKLGVLMLTLHRGRPEAVRKEDPHRDAADQRSLLLHDVLGETRTGGPESMTRVHASAT